jgi:hypothetical protein
VNIFGVDFSGARDAGRKIWVCRALSDGGTLRVVDVLPACDLPGGVVERDRALAALRGCIGTAQPSVWGLDFPFSLALVHMAASGGWRGLMERFAGDFPTPDALRACGDARRTTDIETRTPFAPCNLRLFRQTYYGIRDVLTPLLNAVVIVPMQPYDPDMTTLIEVCPAVALKRLKLYRPYKGAGSERAAMRQTILAHLEQREGAHIPDTLRPLLLENAEGDALDAVIAAFATWKALPHLDAPVAPVYQFEGKVY